jgi:endonuclease-3 related protein
MEIYQRLSSHFGPQHWWPGDSPLEIMIGAILTQNTAWANVEKSIGKLREAGALSFEALRDIAEETLAELIRTCGYYRIKARRIKNLIVAVQEQSGGHLAEFLFFPLYELRKKLLAISGVGPETADSILLYAAQRPIFVVDAYTRRALSRHAWISADAKYEEIQSLFMQLPPDFALYNEFHALWVALGKNYCKPRPRCAGCPLEVFWGG